MAFFYFSDRRIFVRNYIFSYLEKNEVVIEDLRASIFRLELNSAKDHIFAQKFRFDSLFPVSTGHPKFSE